MWLQADILIQWNGHSHPPRQVEALLHQTRRNEHRQTPVRAFEVFPSSSLCPHHGVALVPAHIEVDAESLTEAHVRLGQCLSPQIGAPLAAAGVTLIDYTVNGKVQTPPDASARDTTGAPLRLVACNDTRPTEEV